MPRHAKPAALFESVLCPVDFSSHSRVALQYAAAIASRSHGRLTVMFASDPLLTAAAMAADYDGEHLRTTTERELRQFAARAASRAIPPGRLDTQVVDGTAASAILDAGKTFKADLVVMGTQGLSGASRVLFGSTTAQVLRKAAVPILAVPPAPRRRAGRSWPGDHVLAPLMLGPETAGDASAAAAIADWFDVQLILAHVVEPTRAPRWMGARFRGHDRERLDTARARLERVASRLGLDPDPVTHVAVGEVTAQIAALASDRRIGLMVVTLRAIRGWLGGVPQGTTTYRVLSGANLPVLALPAGWKGGR